MATQSTIAGTGYNNTYIDSLVWGNKWTGSPITYSFGSGYIAGSPQTAENNTQAWSASQQAAFNSVLQLYSNVANLNFTEVDFNGSYNNPNADIVAYSVGDAFWGDTGMLGQFDVPDGKNPVNFGYFNHDHSSWSNLEQGSYGYITLVHEFGHGLGLAHPHDGGGEADGTVFPGVTGPFKSFGTYGLNQGIWTVMSYNDGWDAHRAKSQDYGWEASPMALDIAALQAIYGANTSYHTGNDTYVLPTTNASGTFWSSLWDAGGIDTISNVGATSAAIIDLRAATLVGANAGGYVSFNKDIIGGFTIAHNAVIENAIGGNGADMIYGNSANNNLNGGVGNDTAVYSNTFAQATISYSSSTNAFTITTAAGGTDTLVSIENFKFSDITKTAASLMTGGGVDTTAPTVFSFSPSDGATNVSTTSNIILTYSEAIQRGTGTLVLKDASGTVIESFNAATSPRLSITGSTLTIDPTNALLANGHYFLNFAAGSIEDKAGNGYAGTSSYDFTTAAPEPAATTSTTATLAVGASVNGSIAPAGDHDWYKINLTTGVGYRFDQIASTGSSLDAYLILRNSAGTRLVFDDDNGSDTNALLAYTPTQSGTYYLDAGAYKNSSTGAYSLKASIPHLSDNVAPTVTSFSPRDGAVNVGVSDNITLTFNETIQRGTGTIVLKNAAGTVIESFNAATSTHLTLTDKQLIIDPTNPLLANGHYSVSLAAGSIKDLANNNYAGTTSYDFSIITTDPAGNSNTTATLTIGTDESGFIAANGDHDWFKVNLTSGTVYRFDQIAPAGSNLDSYLKLRNNAGVEIAVDDDSGVFQDAHINYTATRTGVFYIDAGSYNNATSGSYLLRTSQSTLTSAVYGTAGADMLNGTNADDNLFGLGGNDDIDGGLGGDVMTGGAGDDYYYVDNVGDVVVESAGQGHDTVQTAYTSYTLDANVEDLRFYNTVSGNFVGNGNALNNYIEGDTGDDDLYGDAGNDSLNGLAGDDILDGGASADAMEGGQGNDLYYVDAVDDTVIEASAQGNDSILTDLNSYTLDNNVENLLFYGTGDFVGNGNTLANYIEGDISNDTLGGYAGNDELSGLAGNDTLDGGAGKDRLTGGLGADRFIISLAAESGVTALTRDVVTDFNVAQTDKINLSVMDANSVMANNQTFSALVQGGTFSGVFATQGDLYFDKTAHVLYGNNDGDSSADFSIQLMGINSLTTASLIL